MPGHGVSGNCLLYVACAAGGLDQVAEYAVRPLVARGWDVSVVLTTHAHDWLEASGGLHDLSEAAQGAIRTTPAYPRQPSETSGARPDAAVVAPATFTVINKLAGGIADDLASTKLCELMGLRPARPLVIMPRVNAAHTRHPAWANSLAVLRAADGVAVLSPDRVHEPGTPAEPIRWDRLLDHVPDPN